MSKIKFRVWIKDYNYFVLPESFGYMNFSIQMNGKIIHLSGDTPVHDLDEKYVIQQFTGVKDKNGKEIYEGDVIKVLPDNMQVIIGDSPVYDKGEITWICESWKVCQKFIGAEYLGSYVFCSCCNARLEIIGNIFETPNLLK